MRPLFCALLALPILVGSARADEAKPPSKKSSVSQRSLILMPKGIASFGATRLGQYLYVFGGHTGRAHHHSQQNLWNAFYRLNLVDRRSWEELPGATALQAVALIQDGQSLYRVGGLSARNDADEKEDLHSVADFQRYDPQSYKWTALPNLPKALSSHDAIVVNHKVYVFGGWTLAGDTRAWSSHGYVFDLKSKKPAWTTIKQPFQRRALTVAAHKNKIYVVGGMTSKNKISQSVSIYDIKSGTWSEGPKLPGSGFGSAAAPSADGIIASDWTGAVHHLKAGSKNWSTAVTRLQFPRFFHRFIPVSKSRYLAVAGAGKGGHRRTIEELTLTDQSSKTQITHIQLPNPGPAKARQGLFVRNNSLYVFGGNKSTKQHQFDPKHFADDCFQINLSTMKVKRRANFPAKRQSFQSFADKKGTGFALGGFGHDGKVARSQNGLFQYKNSRWTDLKAPLPVALTQFGLALKDQTIWVFGGLDYLPTRKESFRHMDSVFCLDLKAKEKAFKKSAVKLPRVRRAFAGALLENKYYLIGGMKEGFQLVEPCDVFDFQTKSWSSIPAPSRLRISPQMVALDGRLFICGGRSKSPKGNFVPNKSLESYDPATKTWTTILEELPISAKELRMLAFQNQLLVYSAHNRKGKLDILLIQAPARVLKASSRPTSVKKSKRLHR